MDKDRIIKRTQLKRSMLSILGKENDEDDDDESKKNETYDKTSLRDRHLKDYDEEIFDDQDFYNQLVRELIDRRSANVADPIELARKSIELNQLRLKNKKKVDTKASKGRKIRYNVHKPLVNFMAPIYRSQMPEETRYIGEIESFFLNFSLIKLFYVLIFIETSFSNHCLEINQKYPRPAQMDIHQIMLI